MRRFLKREDNGSMMLDGMIAMLITIMILVFLMGFGFLLYQQWLVTNVANDVATRVAQSYAYPNTDPVMGYLNTDMMDSVSIFRYMGNQISRENAEKGEKYAEWSLQRSSMASPAASPKIEVITRHDALARRHVEVTITAEYEIPFGAAAAFLGGDSTVTYTATGQAVCVDILDYVNTVDTFKGLTDATFGSKLVGTINSALGMVKNLVDLFS